MLSTNVPTSNSDNSLKKISSIRILFYAPGTGFETTISDVPSTVPHRYFDANEAKKAPTHPADLSVDRWFTERGAVKDIRCRPGYIQFVNNTSDIKDPSVQVVFDEKNNSTAGHLYQRLIDYNIYVDKKIKEGVEGNHVYYSIYTVFDKPGSDNNLSTLLSVMKDRKYPNNFFDVCITSSDGIDPLINNVNRYALSTDLVLVNGGAKGYLNTKLAKNSTVGAIVLTHGGLDTPVIDNEDVKNFLNESNTKIYIYSNTADGQTPASLILGDTNSLHESMRDKTNRVSHHSYIPILINSAYYVGHRKASWEYLMQVMKQDKYVNLSIPMVGGCGCTTTPRTAISNSSKKESNGQSAYVTTVKCECDRKNVEFVNEYEYSYDTVNFLGGCRGGGKYKESTKLNKEHMAGHYYPDPDASPFDEDEIAETEDDDSSHDEVDEYGQTGGGSLYASYLDIYAGRYFSEIRYIKAKADYALLKNI